MTPTDYQKKLFIEAANAAWKVPGNGSITSCAVAAVTKWEEVRPKEDASQLQRTNHALAAELAGTKETLAESIEQLNRARGLYRAVIDPLLDFFPADTRDLEFDVLPGTIYGMAKKAADLDTVKTELNDRLHERTQAFLAKETALIRQRDALNEQLLDAQYKISMHESHSKDWGPLVSFIQDSKYGTIGECCFAVALRQLKAFEAELAGIKADCRLAESHYEDADRERKAAMERNASLSNANFDLAMQVATVKTELAETKAALTVAMDNGNAAVDRETATKEELKEARRLIANLQDLLQRTLPPAPATFGDPPAGHQWHNPENLTPEQVGIADGWRLMVQGELRTDETQFWNGVIFHRVAGSRARISDGMHPDTTYRTKAPKPTAEELEEKEIKTAFLFAGVGTQSLDSFTAGWKARAAKGGSEA